MDTKQMKKNERFFSKFITVITVFVSLFAICDFANAATRTSTRSAPVSRKNVTSAQKTQRTQPVQQTQKTTEQKIESAPVVETVVQSVVEQPVVEQIKEIEPEPIIYNKSGQFEDVISTVVESAMPDNSFAEAIRAQRAALAASEAKSATTNFQRQALSANSHTCDVGLRKCMSEICGKDFTKCATDGDTDFGDKLNRCRRNTECTAEEFSLFTTEIKADRDANVKLASYNSVIECGNSYNACIMNECGTTYNKCLGKTAENAAIQKCSTIATECRETDSGLTSRLGTAIGKLRENAEKDVKSDESRLYTLRDMMGKQCKSSGAMFDERSFDCVYSIEFYAGENQISPLASRKAYAGDSFICMQEYFGVNATTYRENAYRETRSQTAASSAMLGSGLGVAAGAIASGAIDRAIDTTKAKNALKKECEKQGLSWKECQEIEASEETEETETPPASAAPTPAANTGGDNVARNGCELKFKDDKIASRVAYIRWDGDDKDGMYDRDIDGVAFTNKDNFRITDKRFENPRYRTLVDVVSVNGVAVNFPRPNTNTTHEMIFNCNKWNNGSYIGYDCKQSYKKGNKIGTYDWDGEGKSIYTIYDSCK